MKVYIDPRDWWVGYYRGDRHHYVCVLPTIVLRWPRRPRRPVPAKLVEGELLVAGDLSYPCRVRVVSIDPSIKADTWGWCYTHRVTHWIDRRLFESGRGPWQRL